MAPIRSLACTDCKRPICSAFLFFFDGLPNDVRHVGIAFFLFLDEGGVIEALVHFDFFIFADCGLLGGQRLLALLLGLCVLKRNEFGFCCFRSDAVEIGGR